MKMGKNNCSAKVYSEGEMEALRKNPNVYEVQEHRLLLTLEFRQQVYEEWIQEPKRATVRRMLERNGFDTQRLEPTPKCSNLFSVFAPSGQRH